MADFSALKTSIQNYIKQNGNEEITGNLLQQVLLSMVTTLGDSAINDLVTALGNEVTARQNAVGTLENADTALSGRINTLKGTVDGIIDDIKNGYVYAGIATPSTTPASGKVFYLALTAGTYTNFGATVVPQGINILKYNGSAWSLESFVGIDDKLKAESKNIPTSGAAFRTSIISDHTMTMDGYYLYSYGTFLKGEKYTVVVTLESIHNNIDIRLRNRDTDIQTIGKTSGLKTILEFTAQEDATAIVIASTLNNGESVNVTSYSHRIGAYNEKEFAYNNVFSCSTHQNTAKKVAGVIIGSTPVQGKTVYVTFTKTNYADNVTITFDGVNEYPLYINGERAAYSNKWGAGETLKMYFDGEKFNATHTLLSNDPIFVNALANATSYTDSKIINLSAKTGNLVWERGNVKLENGDIVWYDPTKQTRIRTSENEYFRLEKGTKITALSNVQFMVFKKNDDGSVMQSAWITEYMCPETGNFVIIAQYNDTSTIANITDVSGKIVIKAFELFHKTINTVYAATTSIISDRISQGSQYNNTSTNRCFYNPQEKLKVGATFKVNANSGYRFGFAFVSILSGNKPALIASEINPYVGWLTEVEIVIPENTQSFYMVVSKTDDTAITPVEAAGAFTISYDRLVEQDIADIFNPTYEDIKRLAGKITSIQNSQGLIEFEYGNINFTANGADYLPITHQNTYKRIRTKNAYYIEKGSVIGLSDYTQAKYYIGCRKEDGTYYANGWLTSNFECPYSGWYDIMITHLTDITLTSVEELSSLFSLKPYSSIVRNDVGVPTSVFAGHPFYDHILVNRQTQEQQIIPCQSIAAVNLSARLGFNFIEANTVITSDGVSLTIHGENKTIDGVNGVVFPPSVHYINSETPATDFHVSTKTAQWIRENVRYYSPYSKYETYIPTLKEFCVACRENNIGVLGSFQSTDDIDIALSILGIDRVVCYRNNITKLVDWRTQYPKLTMMYYPSASGVTKDECVANCKAVGTPFLHMLQTITNYTDDELTEIAQAIHKEGCLTGIASNYEGDEATRKAIRCGMDVFASGWQMNPFEGNLLHLRSDLDFSDYDISGDNNVISDGTLVLKSGNYLSKSYNNGQSLFVSKHNLYIRFNGTLGISLTGTGHGATEFEVTSDGTNLEFFSDFGIEKTVSFYLKAIGDVTIYEVQYDASRC